MTDDDTPAPTPTTIDSFVRAAASAPAVERADEPSRLAAVDADRYVDRREIARGGMGRIVAATDQRLARPVAIKELRAHSPELRARFENEALITARLQHPSIVSVLEAGRWPSGEPFFAMRLIAGQPLDQAIAAARALDARLALLPHVLAVADALAYAHQERVIHRDLKPHNVMVGAFGETVVIDWGLAKDLRAGAPPDGAAPPASAEPSSTPVPASASPAPGLTASGSVIGTPAYMAPEQARGEPVDERADVYAIGAILYHLLAGAPPYRETSQTVLTQVLTEPPPPLIEAAPGAPRDLVAIVDRAMARAPGDRYRTAAALTADLRAFLTGQLVGAHHYRALETVGRWLRRHRNAVVVAAVLITALAITAAVGVGGITRERDRATTALTALRARDAELALRQAEASLDRDPTAAIAWIKQARSAAADGWRARALAEVAISRGVARDVVTLGGPATLLVGDGDGAVLADDRGGLWGWTGGRLTPLAHGGARVTAVALAGGGGAVVGDQDGDLRAFDLASGAVTRLGHGGPVRAVAIAPGGDVWSAGADGVVRRWQGGAAPGTAIDVARVDGTPSALAVSGAGGWAVGLDDGAVVIGDPAGGPPRRVQAHTREVGDALFVDDRTLITVAEDGLVIAWEPATGAHRELGRHEDWVSAIAVAPDRRRIATGSADSTIRIWSLDGAAARVLPGHTGTVWALAWAPDGRLASGASDGAIRIWSERLAATSIATGQPVRRLAWVRGGLIAALGDTARVYAAVPTPPHVLAGGGDRPLVVIGSPAGTRVAAGGRDRRAHVWDTASAALIGEQALAAWITTLAFADEDHLTVASETEAIAVDLAHPAARAPIATDLGTSSSTSFPDGAHAAWIDTHTGGALIADLRTGATRTVGDGYLTAIAVVADGSGVVTGARDGAVTVWSLADGAPRVLGALPGAVTGIATSPERRWVVAIGATGPGQAWPLAGGAGRALPAIAGSKAYTVVGDQVLATVGRDLVIVDLGTGATRTLRGHRAELWRLAQSRDGQRLVTADVTCEVRVWRIADGASAVVRGGDGPRCELGLVGADRVAISAGDELHVVALPAALDPHADLGGWLDATTTAVLGPELTPRSPPR